jgi:peptidyl-tRNA hydrolase, PTH1 family
VWLIAGLGNPGKQYESTRHNIGFLVVDELARRGGGSGYASQFKGEAQKVDVARERAVLLKPLTYMNLSGESVQGAMAFFKLGQQDLIVVHDDMDLELGRIKLKQGGGHGGHNGIRDIAQRLGADFYRVRVGVGRPMGSSSASKHVLGGFLAEERPTVERLVKDSADAVGLIIQEGLVAAQLKFHTTDKPAKKKGKDNRSEAIDEGG